MVRTHGGEVVDIQFFQILPGSVWCTDGLGHYFICNGRGWYGFTIADI